MIRAFDKTRFEENRFDLANKDYTNTAIKVNTIVALMMPMMTLIMSGTNVAITWFGGHYIADMTLEVGNLIAFMTYAMQILISFMMLSAIFIMVPRAQASADRINEVLDEKSVSMTLKILKQFLLLEKRNIGLQSCQLSISWSRKTCIGRY